MFYPLVAQVASPLNSTKHFKINKYQFFTNVSKKLEEEGPRPSSFYEAIIILIPKQDKDNTRKLEVNISYEYGSHNP